MSQVARHTLIGQPPGALFTNAREMQAIGGAPALGWIGSSNADRVNVFFLDAVATEDLGYSEVVPPEWQTVSITLVWANSAASVGDVRWTVTWTVAGDSESGLTQTGTNSVTDTAPATAAPLRHTLAAPSIAVVPGKVLVLRVRRSATDAADTLANDAGLVGAIITKVS